MTTRVFMLAATPDRPALAAWAAAERLVGRDADLGYAIHAALAASFGADAAPRPFRLYESAAGVPRLHAYAGMDADALRAHARAFAPPELYRALGVESLASKPMPELFAPGRGLGFEVRVRPVRRRARGGEAPGSRERDVFLLACDRVDPETPVRRDEVYRDWLAERLAAGGARLVGARLTAFRRARVLRRDGGRRLRAVDGPDAILDGTLEVGDPDAFAALLARGVGRHRAFGFGMLLLRPA